MEGRGRPDGASEGTDGVPNDRRRRGWRGPAVPTEKKSATEVAGVCWHPPLYLLAAEATHSNEIIVLFRQVSSTVGRSVHEWNWWKNRNDRRSARPSEVFGVARRPSPLGLHHFACVACSPRPPHMTGSSHRHSPYRNRRVPTELDFAVEGLPAPHRSLSENARRRPVGGERCHGPRSQNLQPILRPILSQNAQRHVCYPAPHVKQGNNSSRVASAVHLVACAASLATLLFVGRPRTPSLNRTPTSWFRYYFANISHPSSIQKA